VLTGLNLFSPPSWRGTRLFAARFTQVPGGYSNAVWSVESDGTDPRQVTFPAAGESDLDPYLSYYGDVLYFTRHPPSGLPYLMQVRSSGGAPTPVTSPAGVPYGTGATGGQ
ncbi:MAG: hypothetical protein M3N43_10225, partial [Actinomycetota bacterium]|nr:hypothetical protein [Actinomycetota bacterium]